MSYARATYVISVAAVVAAAFIYAAKSERDLERVELLTSACGIRSRLAKLTMDGQARAAPRRAHLARTPSERSRKRGWEEQDRGTTSRGPRALQTKTL